jgi:catechol 2,3-dioxygenase-like lactoylglutathione lyase family enzyme
MRLHHVAVVCSSQENADRFYEGVLGLRKIRTSPLSEELGGQIFDIAQKCQIILYASETFAVEVFVPASPPKKRAPFLHLCLEVENREEFVERCHEMALPVKRIEKGDSLLTFVQDYDGNLFEIRETPG